MIRFASAFGLVAALFCVTPVATHALEWTDHPIEGPDGKTMPGQLASIPVPERRGAADTAQVDLHFVRLPTTAGKPAAPIVFLNGGPGASGIRIARVPGYFETFEALTAVADVILLDQRGTGMSSRGLYCPPADRLPPLDVFANPERLRSMMEKRIPACREELEAKGIDLAGYTTRESADDLEALRQALGVERLNLLGFSYGTHLGLSVVRRHGERLERVALIGVEGPDHTRKLPLALDTQVRKLSLLIARDPTMGSKVPDFYGLLQKVLRQLAEEPIVIPIPDKDGTILEVPVGPEGLQMILAWDLGDGNDFPVFPALLLTIERGDPSLLGWFVRKRAPRLSGAVSGLYLAMDGASGASLERWARIEREAPGAILGNVANALFPQGAELLGIEPLDETFRSPIVSDVHTLFITGTLDSNSPPYQAQEIAWGFPRSNHLVIENAGHEDMLGHPEVSTVLVDFFRGEDVSERSISLPTPRFLSVEEAKAQRLGSR